MFKRLPVMCCLLGLAVAALLGRACAQETTASGTPTTAAVAVAARPDVSTTASSLAVTGARQVILARLNDEIINPVTSRFLMSAIDDAEKINAPVVIELDTPGGLLQSTRDLVKRILASKIPVITFVYPSGSRAGSAGVFVAYASHIAAMAPATNIGAAHVVDMTGRFTGTPDGATTQVVSFAKGTSDILRQLGGSPMEEKVMNDTLAWIEGLARLRGRNVEWAKAAVERSVSVTAEDALRLNVINYVAVDIDDLLRKVDGTTVTVADNRIYEIRSAGAPITTVELSTRQRILNTLANPNLAYILLLLGFAGLAYEVTHPGFFFPGLVGAVCLLLAALALQMLPTNYAAVLLIIAGLGLIVAEVKFHTYGFLTLLGAACLFFGSLAMFDARGPFIGVSIELIVPVVIAITTLLALLVTLVIRSHGRQPSIGPASYIGATAEVMVPLEPNGKVFFNGTLWDAGCDHFVGRGTPVKIIGMERLKLRVEPLKKDSDD